MSEDMVAKREKYWWEHYSLHQLWCNDACPLVPRFNYRKGDEFNSNGWSLHWLIFHLWSLDNFAIGAEVEFSPSEGIWIGFILPYLRIFIGIRHTYYAWQYKIGRMLRRKPALKNDKGEYN